MGLFFSGSRSWFEPGTFSSLAVRQSSIYVFTSPSSWSVTRKVRLFFDGRPDGWVFFLSFQGRMV